MESFFMLLAICCLRLHGADSTNMIEFAKSLPKRGSVQWEVNQQLNQQRQEVYRKRVAIPDATSPFVPRDAKADLINGKQTPPVHADLADNPGVNFLNLLFFSAIIFLAVVLIVRKIAPQILVDLNQQFNPWAMGHAEARSNSSAAGAEGKPYGEFLTAFRVGPALSPQANSAAEDDPHKEFYARAKKRLAAQRKLLEQLRRKSSDAALKKFLVDLYFEFGGLKDEASFPAALPVWQMATALEGLLKELTGRIRNVTPSTVRAIAGGLDLLDKLCVPGVNSQLLTNRPFKFLVVEDDLISRQALSLALAKAFSQPDLAVNGEKALVQASGQAYDAIFLDVQLPGMDGFELCTKIRGSGLNRATPVIFVTSQSDFDARARSMLIGGNDLMGKPFLIFEVTLKALTHAFEARLQA